MSAQKNRKGFAAVLIIVVVLIITLGAVAVLKLLSSSKNQVSPIENKLSTQPAQNLQNVTTLSKHQPNLASLETELSKVIPKSIHYKVLYETVEPKIDTQPAKFWKAGFGMLRWWKLNSGNYITVKGEQLSFSDDPPNSDKSNFTYNLLSQMKEIASNYFTSQGFIQNTPEDAGLKEIDMYDNIFSQYFAFSNASGTLHCSGELTVILSHPKLDINEQPTNSSITFFCGDQDTKIDNTRLEFKNVVSRNEKYKDAYYWLIRRYDNYALLGVNNAGWCCGMPILIVKKTGDEWSEVGIGASADSPLCSDLDSLGIPRKAYGICYETQKTDATEFN